jgi:hypothetical protein
MLVMTDDEIRNILNSNELSEIEAYITSECKTYVNKEFIDFTIDILRREITNSGLAITYIEQQLVLKKDLIIKLGIKILKTLRNKPIEEEYPKGEEIPRNEKSKVITSHGVGIGFGVKYAIYLDFLENNPKELIQFIKKERIPNAEKFSKMLQKFFNN